MKKKLYFTSRADEQKEANEINTYVGLIYDTETGELNLYDSFNGEVLSTNIATISKSSETTTTPSSTVEP